MIWRYLEELASHFKEMKTNVHCNIQGQNLDPGCEIISTLQIYSHCIL
jgi:hypothetical protein